MKIFIFLSLPTTLFLGTFFEVDSSHYLESSSGSSKFASALESPYREEFNSSNSQTGKQPVEEPMLDKLSSPEIDSSYFADASSSDSRKRKQPVKKNVFKKFSSLQIVPMDRPESSLQSAQIGKQPVEELRLEWLKEKMRKLYKNVGHGRCRLHRAMERKDRSKATKAIMRSVERQKAAIVALRSALRETMRMRSPEYIRKKQNKIFIEIEETDRRLKKISEELRELKPKCDNGNEIYSKLVSEERKNNQRYTELWNTSNWYDKMLLHYKYPELVDRDIVPHGFGDLPE